jgi:hypothetical protein
MQVCLRVEQTCTHSYPHREDEFKEEHEIFTHTHTNKQTNTHAYPHREDEREEEHEETMHDITKRVRALKEESTQKAADLEVALKYVFLVYVCVCVRAHKYTCRIFFLVYKCGSFWSF